MKMKKIFVLGVILLFVGVTIAPTINFQVVKASTDDNLVEVTTQAYGIQGYGNTTVKLTREQYQDLEQYLVEFRARLNQTSTREELISLYREAIVELNDYGLLPKGMSISLAERLVIGSNLYDKLPGFFKRISLLDIDDIENMKCFVYAEGIGLDEPLWFSILLNIVMIIADKLFNLENDTVILLGLIFMFLGLPFILFSKVNPIHILSDVLLLHGDNNKLTTVSFFPFKIYKGDAVDRDYELFGYTGLKLITPEIEYYYGRTLLVINQH